MPEFVQLPRRLRGNVTGAAGGIHEVGRGAGRVRNRWVILAALALAGVHPGTAAGQAASQTQAAPNAVPKAANDSFAHTRHQKLPCMTCHLSSSGAMLTFQPPRGCQICHHTVQAKQRLRPVP